MKNYDLNRRMKMYEAYETKRMFIPRLPVLVRLDGKAFHTWTKGLKKPFDGDLHMCFVETTKKLVESTSARTGYTQSDEITLLFYTDDQKSQIYFNGKTQKLVSVLASMTTSYFDRFTNGVLTRPRVPPLFDCRAWTVPNREEAANVFVWREQDAVRNSIQGLGQAYFSHKQLHKKSCDEIQEMLFSEHGINWNDCPDKQKRGTYVQRQEKLVTFTPEELDRLPEKHEAHLNPDLKIKRHVVESVHMPPLTTVTNRVSVLFDGTAPLTNKGEKPCSLKL